MTNKKFSLVVPAYNEALIIGSTVKTILEYLETTFSDYELIISDDGSTDETRAIVENIEDSHLICIGHTPNKGKGAAVREGILAAGGGIIVCTDADLAYGVEILGKIAQQIADGEYDLVIGSRKLHPEGYADYPPLRLVASRCFSSITGKLAGFRYDTQCGLKAYTAPAARQIFSRCVTDGFAFDFEAMMIASKLGLNVGQLPVKIENHRDSKVRVLSDSLKMLKDVVGIRRRVDKTWRKEKV